MRKELGERFRRKVLGLPEAMLQMGGETDMRHIVLRMLTQLLVCEVSGSANQSKSYTMNSL